MIKNFFKSVNVNNEEKKLIESIYSKYKNNITELLTTRKVDLYNNIILKLNKGINKDLSSELVYKFKLFVLENLNDITDITKIEDNNLLKIEKFNKLNKYTLLEEKRFYQSWYYKEYGGKYTKIHDLIMKEVIKNQKYRKKLNFKENQKIMIRCCEESYKFSKKDRSYRPESFLDSKFNTIYQYDNQISDINRSIWVNENKNSIDKSKVVVVAYRGTGVSKSDKKFNYNGNAKRDLYLDYKIYYGTLTDSKQMKKIIEDFDNIYKNFGKEYKFYLTGHSLGGRLAFEVHRKRPKKIAECHIFNAGFGNDLKYLHDIMISKKRNMEWEKNVYNYHIGGKEKGPGDDDYISVLAGGYGTSYTYYGKFNSYLKGHGLINFH